MMPTVKTTATLTAIFLLSVSIICAQQMTLIEEVYDVALNRTTVQIPFSRISGEKDRYHSLDLAASYTYSGRTNQVPEFVNLELFSVVKARKLNPDLYVAFIADGETLHFGSSRAAVANPVKGKPWIGERMNFKIPLEKFEKLASAKELAIKVGATLVPLDENARVSLDALAKHSRGQSPPRPMAHANPR